MIATAIKIYIWTVVQITTAVKKKPVLVNNNTLNFENRVR